MKQVGDQGVSTKTIERVVHDVGPELAGRYKPMRTYLDRGIRVIIPPFRFGNRYCPGGFSDSR